MPDTFAYPLSDFYAHAKLPLPPIEIIAGRTCPRRIIRCWFITTT
jgi:hypothetical protein